MKRLEGKADEQEVVVETLAEGPPKIIHESHRFFILMLGAFGCCCAAFNYAFNLISKPMQERYDLTQRDMGTILTVGLVLKYILTPYAFIFDRAGPLPVSVIMTTYFTIGSVCLALCFSGHIQGNVLRLSVFNAFLTCGGSMFDMVCCMTILNHFPANKGAAAMFMKAFTGLGSALAGSLYTAFFNKRADLYFFFLMSIAIVVGSLFILFVRQPPYYILPRAQVTLTPEEVEERKVWKAAYLKQRPPIPRFIYGYSIVFFLIVYLPMTSSLTVYLHLSQKYKVAFAVVSAILWLMVPLIAVPIPGLNGPENTFVTDDRQVHANEESSSRALSEEIRNYLAKDASSGTIVQQNTPGNPPDDSAVGQEHVPAALPETDMDYVAPQYQHSFVRNLLTLELWGLWWTMFCCIGAQFVVIFNANYILAALSGKEPSDSLRAMLTVLNGVGGAIGRLLMSYFEIWTQKRKAEDRVPLTISLFIPVVPVILTFVLFLVLPAAALPLPYAITAFGSGFSVAICVLLTRTIYAKDSALHYNYTFTAVAAASVVLNRFLYAEWYAVQAEKRGKSKVCYDRACVLMPMLVLIGLGCSALLSSFIVHIRYCRFYERALKERERIRKGTLVEEVADRQPDAEGEGVVVLEQRAVGAAQ